LPALERDMTDSTPHSSHTPATGPAVGQDEWVARHAARGLLPEGPLRRVEERLRVVPWWAWLVLFLATMSLLPVVESSGYVRRVGFDTVLYMLLALGLNIVVGWGGLLDLGYVAFYGIGAYAYAILDSDKFGIHLPTIVAVPLVVVIGAVAGFLVGLPSRRLTGDYLAIVTLFFLQLFQTVMTNGDSAFGHNLTGGPNGILNIDPLHLFGHDLTVQHQGVFAVSYFYVALAFFAVVYVALKFVNASRTGRAWRSLREDPLAAEAMGMPVNWLKLLSFSFGAAVAALTGTLFASLNVSVFPLTFYFVLLITVYTMVILGGSGSQPGVVAGALIISPLLEMLRDPGKSRVIFFAVLVGGIAVAARRSRALGITAAATLAFGFAAHEIARAIDSSWVSGERGGGFAGFVDHWVIHPAQLASWIPPVSYVGLIAATLGVTLLHGHRRLVALVPTLYLAAFVWENVMLSKPEPARYIVLGMILIALMILRPSGLLGERRVEIV
jgi:ABC-type branched-subunit amino acid transport system permease subunit